MEGGLEQEGNSKLPMAEREMAAKRRCLRMSFLIQVACFA